MIRVELNLPEIIFSLKDLFLANLFALEDLKMLT